MDALGWLEGGRPHATPRIEVPAATADTGSSMCNAKKYRLSTTVTHNRNDTAGHRDTDGKPLLTGDLICFLVQHSKSRNALQGELFFLYMLINNDNSRGAVSYEDLRTVNNIIHPTFRKTCETLGLCNSDSYVYDFLKNATHHQTSSQLRMLLCILLEHHPPTDPMSIFSTFSNEFSDDFRYRSELNNNLMTSEEATLLAFHDIHKRLLLKHKDPLSMGLNDISSNDMNKIKLIQQKLYGNEIIHSNPLLTLHKEIMIDIKHLQDSITPISASLNIEQQQIIKSYELMLDNDSLNPKCMCILAAAGTGKTLIMNHIINICRLRNKVVLAVASTGIASTLLEPPAGTFHSTFQCPIELDTEITLNIPGRSYLADLIRAATTIVWDEISMSHHQHLDALDRALRDICRENGLPHSKPFANKIIIVGGDMRQTLPIDIDDRSHGMNCVIMNAQVWPLFNIYHLTKNMRLQLVDKKHCDLFKFIHDLGNGSLQEQDIANIVIPRESVPIHLANIRTAIGVIYKDIQSHFLDTSYFHERLLLAPHHRTADKLNRTILQLLPGNVSTSYSSNEIVPDYNDSVNHDFCISNDYLSTLDFSNFPPHKLCMKKGMIVILLTSLDTEHGLCNGRRLMVKEIKRDPWQLITERLDKPGQTIVLPRIRNYVDSRKFGFKWVRTQFPVIPAFALTINKSQGQNVNHCGIYLEEPVFAHGQLYTAMTRCRIPDNIHFFLPDPNNPTTINVCNKRLLKYLSEKGIG
eukprot:GHVU01066950.1.p1 GENE.GHVU01066950.1~~GHVU01066950.1.p1  ORF type:complete len:751 (+),score=28.79 GHVU01066950.1:725-2977(+)